MLSLRSIRQMLGYTVNVEEAWQLCLQTSLLEIFVISQYELPQPQPFDWSFAIGFEVAGECSKIQ